MVFSVPSLEKRFFIFRLTRLTPPHFLGIAPREISYQARGWVFSIYPSIFTNPPSSLYSSSVSISVSSSLMHLYPPPPHYQKTQTQEKKTCLLKLKKKSAHHFLKPFFRRVKEFLESRLAQNSFTIRTRLCQGEFVVAIYSHIHKREAAQIFLTQF